MRERHRLIGWVLSSWLLPLGFLCGEVTAQPASDEVVLRGHLGPVMMGTFTPGGERAITVSTDQTARLWDLQSRSQVRQYEGHTGPIFCLAISGDGRTLVTGGQDNTLRVWDVPQTKPVRWLAGHDGSAVGLAVTADGRSIASVGADRQLRLWDTTNLSASLGNDTQPVDPATGAKQLSQHNSPVTAIAYRNDGNLIATADDQGRIVFWSPYLNEPQGQVEGAAITSLSFHNNNQQLFAAGSDGLIRVWQLPAPLPRQITGITTAIEHFAVMNNQATAVFIASDRVIRVINLETNEIVHEFPKRDKHVTAISLSANNAVLAIAEEGGRVVLLNVTNGEEQGSFRGDTETVSSIQFHVDNQQIFAASIDGSLWQWRITDEPTSEPIAPLQSELPKGPSALALADNGATMFLGNADGKIRQLRVNDGAVERTLEGHAGAITDLIVAANSQRLASVSRDKTLRIWNTADGSLVHTILHPAALSSVTISANSLKVATFSDDGKVRIFDLISGLSLEEFTEHEAGTGQVRWLNDNVTLASASIDKSLRIHKSTSLRSFRVHENAVTSMALYNGGAQTVSCSTDGKAVMCDANSGQVVREFPGVVAEPQVIAARSDNQRIAVGTNEGNVFVWNAGNAELLQTLAVDGSVRAISWSPDNQKLAVSTESKELFIFGPPQPAEPGTELVMQEQTTAPSLATGLLFDRDNRTIWASHASGHLAQWSIAAPGQLRQFNHGGPVYGVATSQDGKTIVSGSTDQTIRVWDADSGRQRFQMRGHQGPVHSVALSPDESFVVSSGADRTLRLWDVVGGRQLKQLATLDETMYSVVVHPNGELVAAAGADRKVYLFNLITGAVVQTMEGHPDYIHSVAFNREGTRLLSYGYAGQLRIWEPDSGKMFLDDQIGRIGNDARYRDDGLQILLSNGDGTARVFDVPPTAR